MDVFPKLSGLKTRKKTIENFGGMDRLGTEDGGFSDLWNIAPDDGGRLRTRPGRAECTGLTGTMPAVPWGLLGGEKLIYADKDGIHSAEAGRESWNISAQSESFTGRRVYAGKKTLLRLGGQVLVLPDKLAYRDSLAGPMDSGQTALEYENYARPGVAGAPAVILRPCRRDGTPIPTPSVRAAPPAPPADGMVWTDTSQSPHRMYIYEGAAKRWREISDVCIRMDGVFPQKWYDDYQRINESAASFLRAGDSVTVQGFGVGTVTNTGGTVIHDARVEQLKALNGSRMILAAAYRADLSQDPVLFTDDSDKLYLGTLVFPGFLDGPCLQTSGSLSVRRRLPWMDLFTAAGGRLWGCRYGTDERGEPVNVIYASAQGDPRIFYDPERCLCIPVGSAGQFTAAAEFNGEPVFFKEDRLYHISVSASGTHQIRELACAGVRQGCDKSPAQVDGKLYYQGVEGVWAYDGRRTARVDDCLGTLLRTAEGGVACGDGRRYYLNVQPGPGRPRETLVLDTRTGRWSRGEGDGITALASAGGGVYALKWARGDTGAICELTGHDPVFGRIPGEAPAWYAESGTLPECNYLRRMELALQTGGDVRVYGSFDGGDWELLGVVSGEKTLPIRPRRCKHFRLRLEGGDSTVLSRLSWRWEPTEDEA